MRIIGVDHSLTCTGVAFVAADAVQWTRSIKTQAPPDEGDELGTRMTRIAVIARAYSDMLEEVAEHPDGGPLVVTIETRDFQTKEPGHASDRAGVWVQLLVTSRAYGAHLVGVAPTTLKVYATGNGRSSKPAVHEAVEATYGHRCATHDEADALTLAAMTADWYGRPLVALGDLHRRTIGRPRWPMITAAGRPPVVRSTHTDTAL